MQPTTLPFFVFFVQNLIGQRRTRQLGLQSERTRRITPVSLKLRFLKELIVLSRHLGSALCPITKYAPEAIAELKRHKAVERYSYQYRADS